LGGAGAVGSALGGLLARAGKEVLLVARGNHQREVAGNGLSVRCPDTAFTVRVPSVTGPEGMRLTRRDVLVLTTKTQQAEAALAQWADVPVHDADGQVVGRASDQLPILTALNGVAGEEIALRYFDRVFGVCVWFPTVMLEPGEVLMRGAPLRGIFHIGRYGISPDPREDTAMMDALRRDWMAADFEVVQPGDVMRWKYRKLIANVGNVLQALLGDTTDATDLRRAADAEAREVLVAAGISIPDDQEASAAWAGYAVRPVPGEPAVMGGRPGNH